MHLIYIDESGNTGSRRDPDQPLHLIAALIVHESKIRAIEDCVDETVARYFPDIKGEKNFELHAAEMFGGKGLFKRVDPAVRIQAINEVLDALIAQEAKVVWSAIDKMRNPSTRHPHQLAFQFLAERLEDYLKRDDSLGLIVADENKEIEQKIIDDLTVYKASTTGWGYRPTEIRHIVDSVHFVQSYNNRLIQCADLVAYFTLRSKREHQKLIDAYLALPDPKPFWHPYLQGAASASQIAVMDLGSKISRMVVSYKLYPA